MAAIECVCSPLHLDGQPYIQWIGTWFGDCVYSTSDKISFYAGLLSIMAYAVAMFPQYYRNFQRKSVEGLSPGLIALWTSGDACNLVGSVLSNQLPTQRLTATFFVCTDILMAIQFLCIPQVIQNYQIKSVRGLSVQMFVLMILGNIGYGISVIMRFPVMDAHFFAATLPFIIGSMGVLIFDSIIFVQAMVYGGF
eukprot:jgi/Hompol1/1872/HPOL_002782-RA